MRRDSFLQDSEIFTLTILPNEPTGMKYVASIASIVSSFFLYVQIRKHAI